MLFSIRNKLLFTGIAILLTGCSKTKSLPDPVWVENEFPGINFYAGQCSNLREQFFLRSVFNYYYYWYEDIVDANPANFSSPAEHFDYLVTDDITASGKRKDAYSTFISIEEYQNLVSGNAEIGYGMRLTSSEPDFKGEIRVGYVVPGYAADMAGIERGDQIASVDGFGFDEPDRSLSLPALFPRDSGETHDFQIVGKGVLTLASAEVDFTPVQFAQVLPGNIGYLFFDDHARDAEELLIDAFNLFAAHNAGNGVDELVLDLRYNSGGLLYIANQVAYMVAGAAQTDGKVFERLRYNNRFSPENLFFLSTGWHPDTGNNTPLPTLALDRVVVISDHGTCSASESIINALRGVDVDVILVGEKTCGKPFGFIGFNNCGTTWLPVEFQSFNHKDESNYADGFHAGSEPFGEQLPGCVVSDDFASDLGDPAERRIAAAVQYLGDSSCPAVTAFSAASATAPVAASRTAIPAAGLRQSAGLLRATDGLRLLTPRDEATAETDSSR